jgi:hypothetical protein
LKLARLSQLAVSDSQGQPIWGAFAAPRSIASKSIGRGERNPFACLTSLDFYARPPRNYLATHSNANPILTRGSMKVDAFLHAVPAIASGRPKKGPKGAQFINVLAVTC